MNIISLSPSTGLTRHYSELANYGEFLIDYIIMVGPSIYTWFTSFSFSLLFLPSPPVVEEDHLRDVIDQLYHQLHTIIMGGPTH